MPELAKVQGELWKALSDEARQVYLDQQAEDRVRYEREMVAAGLPLPVPKERRVSSGARGSSGGGGRKKAVAEWSEGEEEDEDEEIEWYVPEGFTVQEAPPGPAELAFSSDASAPGDALVGRVLLFNWEGVGWCEGIVEERNQDDRFQLDGDHVNFWVYYSLDDNLSKHVLEVEDYAHGPDAPDGSWVLLSPIEGNPAAERSRRELTAEEKALEAADRERMAVEEAAEREAEAKKAAKGAGSGRKKGKEAKAEAAEPMEQETPADEAADPLPQANERYFVPASLWPTETPNKTAHGEGWLASVIHVSAPAPSGKKRKRSAGKAEAPPEDSIVTFKCDGEDEPVTMAVGAFVENCKRVEY